MVDTAVPETDKLKTARLLEGREREQDCKLTFVRKFFPNTNLTPGGTCKLRGRKDDIHTHGLTANLSKVSNIDRNTATDRPTKTSTHVNVTPKRRHVFQDNTIFTPNKKIKFSENLNFWRQSIDQENSDLVGELGELTRKNERNNRPGGSK